MTAGEFLTQASVWTSIATYTAGCVLFAWRAPRFESATRLAWTVACGALIAHYICAFEYYHAWSHTAAYIDTARQTERVFALNWGGGLFVNYALGMLWIIDVGSWWLAGLDSYRRRPRILLIGWHAFLLFIIFNATVVFEDGWQRAVGVLVCAVLLLSWFAMIRRG